MENLGGLARVRGSQGVYDVPLFVVGLAVESFVAIGCC